MATLALVVWNIGTRSPLDLVRDIRLSLKRPRAIFTGLVCFAVGMIFVAAATILLIPTLPRAEVELVPAEILMFLVALVLEHLIGPQLRNLVTGSATSRS